MVASALEGMKSYIRPQSWLVTAIDFTSAVTLCQNFILQKKFDDLLFLISCVPIKISDIRGDKLETKLI